MRLAATTLLALALSGTAATAADAPGGSLAVEHGRGIVQIKGKGALVGVIEKGTLKIVDQSPSDQWSPRVNGVPRGKTVWLRGQNVTFYVPGGRYQLIAQGEGISISARGTGQASLDGNPDPVGDTGLFAVGDQPKQPIPTDAVKLSFGTADSQPSARSFRLLP